MRLHNKKTGETAIFTIIRHTVIGDDYTITFDEFANDWEPVESCGEEEE